MSYIERQDVANLGARAQNQSVYGPPTITEIQDNFGAKSVAVYIYNIGNLEHNVPRPPNHPHMLLRACPAGQAYLLAGEVTHPFNEVAYDINGNQLVRLTDGIREAARMLNPMNPGTDQNYDGPSVHEGDNLNAYGCFFSTNSPPLQEELDAAKARMEKTFRKELEVMAAV